MTDAAVYDAVQEAAAAFGRIGALVGLDLGEKTIGVAVSDPMRAIATPIETLKRGKFAHARDALVAVAEPRAAVGWVLGLPRNMDGGEGPRAQSSRAFARNLCQATGLPVLLWDERLSTAAVERTLIEADASRRRRAEVVDKLAAAYILQGALDRLRVLALEDDEQDDDRDR